MHNEAYSNSSASNAVTEVTSPDDHSFQDLSSANTATGIASPDDLSFQGLHSAYPILEDNDQVSIMGVGRKGGYSIVL